MASRTVPTTSSALRILQLYSSDTESSDSDNESSTQNGESFLKNQNNDTSACPCNPSDFGGDVSLPSKRRRIEEPAEDSQETQRIRNSGQSIVQHSSSIPLRHGQSQVRSPLVLPSVPDKILDMFSNKEEGNPKDDPDMHSGRIRSFPHVRGNWASYVYISCLESSDVVAGINGLLLNVGEPLMSSRSLHLIDDKHISLSRTLSFRHHWIDPFNENLKNVASKCDRFHICFDKFDVYTNDEKSRTFIGMKTISTGNLLDMVKQCDQCLDEFQLEPYYKDPSFHASCAWMLGDQSEWAKQILIPYLNERWSQLLENDPDLPFLPVSALEFKTGNKLYRFSFRNS